MVELTEHFRTEGPGRGSDWDRQRKWFIKAKHEQQRREDHEDKLDASVTALSAAVAVATDVQVKAFKLKLDTYDSATVNALMDNQELLDAVNARLESMLARAHVLEDGRRVFKTEDGTQVFDEHGVEVGVEDVDPDAIDPTKPTWEAFSAEVEMKEHLVQQRSDILEFQEQLDATRDRADEGDLTEANLEELDTELLAVMPHVVKNHVPGLDARAPKAAQPVEASDNHVAQTAQINHTETTTPVPSPFQ